MNIRHTLVGLAAVTVLALLGTVGCASDNPGGRPGADAAAPSADTDPATQAADAVPCPLDPVVMSSVIGVEMTKAASARCGVVAESPQPGRVIEVYYTPIDAMVYDRSEGEAVAGVGDGARWDTQMSGSLLVKTGSRHFSVQAVAMGDLPERLRAKNLAVTVARTILNRPNR